MHEHGIDDDLLGNLQELLVEGAHHGRGVLGEVDDLGKRLSRKLGSRPARRLDGGYAVADDGLALGLGRHHVGTAHHVHQRVGRGHLVRPGSQEAMAAGRAPGGDARIPNGNHLVAQKRHQPAHRTREHLARGAPAARLRPADVVDHTAQHARQKRSGLLGGHLAHGVDVLGAVLVAALQVVHGKPLAAGESLGGLGGPAGLVEGNGDGRPAEDLLQGLGGRGHVGHHGDETARTRVDGHIPVGNAHRVQGGGHKLGQLLGGALQIEGGNLLGADLEGKGCSVRHLRPPHRSSRQ